MIVTPTDHSVTFTVGAALLDEGGPGTPLKAWAERYVRADRDLRWVLGNYVEADNANDNGHIFPRSDLATAQVTLAGKPLNMMHREHYIVGYFAGSQLMTEDGIEVKPGDAGNGSFESYGKRPYLEALAGMWHGRFPEEFFQIRKAHSEGSLFFSMEAIPESVSCPTCEHASPFAGLVSESYCSHMNGATGPKRLHNPTFNGGAIIIPPVRPGWQKADIKEISKLAGDPTAESVYAGFAAAAPHLEPAEWESLMVGVLKLAARDVSGPEREKLAKQDKALPDGSFPIANASDLRNAIKAVGRAKDQAAAKAHIKRRAKALGLSDLIPEGW